MNFQCPKCKSYNTDDRGKNGVCYDCKTFFDMGGAKINWNNVIIFEMLVITFIMSLYWLGVLK